MQPNERETFKQELVDAEQALFSCFSQEPKKRAPKPAEVRSTPSDPWTKALAELRNATLKAPTDTINMIFAKRNEIPEAKNRELWDVIFTNCHWLKSPEHIAIFQELEFFKNLFAELRPKSRQALFAFGLDALIAIVKEHKEHLPLAYSWYEVADSDMRRQAHLGLELLKLEDGNNFKPACRVAREVATVNAAYCIVTSFGNNQPLEDIWPFLKQLIANERQSQDFTHPLSCNSASTYRHSCQNNEYRYTLRHFLNGFSTSDDGSIL